MADELARLSFLGMGWFTPHITLFTNGAFEVGPNLRTRLTQKGYRLNEQPIHQFLGENHQMSGVELVDGSTVDLDAGLVSMGSKYHADYLQGIELEYKGGNLVADEMRRTSHPRIFAVGDLKLGMNQVVIAASNGALAVTQVWRDICRREASRRKPVFTDA